jgi:hypothetical protein
MTYTTNTSRDRRRADLRPSNIRRLIDVTGALLFTTLTGIFITFILVNWITGCGERFQHMDGTYTQGECITPLDLLNNHRDTQTPLEDNT